MDIVLINKKTVRKNKALKLAQKAAKRRYGRVRGVAPKAKIPKIVMLKNEDALSFVPGKTVQKESDTLKLDQQSLIAAVREAALNGLSGSGFPTSRKLESLAASQAKAKYFIVNAVECEPGLLHDEWILEHLRDDVKYGIRFLKKCFSFSGVFLAAKTDCASVATEYQYVRVPSRYPMGQEKLLIKSVLGMELSNEAIPAEKGVLVLNIQTVLAIGELIKGVVPASRYMTAADLSDGSAFVVQAEMGAPISEIAQRLFPEKKEFYVGSGVMSAHLMADDEKVNASTCFIGCGSLPDYESASKCKGCGGCSRFCPMKLDVKGIIRALEKGKTGGFEAFHTENCIGCGSCTYICAAGKNIQNMIAKINEDRAL